MGVKDRRARQKTLLRQQILDAARDLLVRDGYEKLSMRRVAERIDYSPTAIYLHFKDKQELVSSLCDETFARLIRELETLPDEYADPVVRLRHGLERYIAFGLTHPDHYLPAFVLPMPADLDPKRKAETVSSASIRISSVSGTKWRTSARARISGVDPGRPNPLAPGPKSTTFRVMVMSPHMPVCHFRLAAAPTAAMAATSMKDARIVYLVI